MAAATACALLLGAGGAGAADAGSAYLSVGYARMRAADADTRARAHVTRSPGTVALGIPDSFALPDIELRPDPADVLVFGVGYFVSEQLTVSINAGVPPKIRVRGRGVVAPPGAAGLLYQLDLADPQLNPLATPRQWSPVLAVQYRFRQPGHLVRPFVGAGATYTWFTDEGLNPAFAAALDERFGQPLANGAQKPGPTTSKLRIDSLWTGSAAAGAVFALAPRWSLTGSLAWAPLPVRSRLTMRAQDGSILARGDARVDVDGWVGTLTADYRFGG